MLVLLEVHVFIKDFRSKTVQLTALGIQTIQQCKGEPQNSLRVAPEVQQYTGITIINLQGCSYAFCLQPKHAFI